MKSSKLKVKSLEQDFKTLEIITQFYKTKVFLQKFHFIFMLQTINLEKWNHLYVEINLRHFYELMGG